MVELQLAGLEVPCTIFKHCKKSVERTGTYATLATDSRSSGMEYPWQNSVRRAIQLTIYVNKMVMTCR